MLFPKSDLWHVFGTNYITLFFFFAGVKTSVSAVQGSSVELPCNITAPIYGDKVRLVLWYKNESFNPIYT